MSQICNNLRREAYKATPFISSIIGRQMPIITFIPNRTRYYKNRHRDPLYRIERTRKLLRIELPDFDKGRDEYKQDLTPEEMRSKMKEKGIAPPQIWDERTFFTPCTMQLIDPEKSEKIDDEKKLIDKAKTALKPVTNLIKTKRETSKIRDFEGDDFNLDGFGATALDIYIKAHEALAAKDEQKLLKYVTEYCFPIMTEGVSQQTIMWKYQGEIERPKVIRVRGGDVLDKMNRFAQITVRFHTKQTLAIFDRHGRLIHGGPNSVRDVLEDVVFEKYLANEYGEWRVHGRLNVGQ